MAVSSWEADSQGWDTLVLGGNAFPGVWTVRPQFSVSLDIKVRRGQDAAVIKDRGAEPVRFSIEGQVMADDASWPEFVRLFPTLAPRRGQARGAITIVHPAAQMYGVTAVKIESVAGPEIRNGIGVFDVVAIEDVPRTKKKRPQPNSDFAGGGILGLDYPNWQRNSPFASSQPPTNDVDLDVLLQG